MRRLSVAMVVAVLGASWPAASQDISPQTNPQTPSIVTTGEATVRRAANQAFVMVAVETRARAPKDAQKQNADLMTAVQQRLADAGLSKDAIRTTGYAIQQEFDYVNGRRIPREYVARNGLEVRVDAIERTGDILDLVVQAGATSVSGVRFDLTDRAAVERDALRHAVEDARSRAEAMAAGAGRTVDRVIRIDDSRQSYGVQPQPVMAMRAAEAGSATPIEAGLIEIHARVVLTVSIK